MTARRWMRRLAALVHGGALPVWYHPEYRLPMGVLTSGVEPRRADLAVWALLELGAIREADTRLPERVDYQALSRVHTEGWLEALARPETLGALFGAPPAEVQVDPILTMVRLATGGTVAAARAALARGGPTLNLLGGFHHARPDLGAGLCPVNDVAVAFQAVRDDGFAGPVVVLDLDAHPPDGIAACMAGRAWIGSISGSDWGRLEGVDETVLKGADDATYLDALERLLDRMPRPGLAFVIAGGDVLAGDRMGCLGLSLAGARRRDLMVARALHGAPSVWLPGGGYTANSWRVLAGTGLALALGSDEPIPADLDPLTSRFVHLYDELRPERLTGEAWLTAADLEESLGLRRAAPYRLLGYYTAEGIEVALHHYGLLAHVARLGYRDFRVSLGRGDVGERMQLFGRADGDEHLLVEAVLERVLEPLPTHPELPGGGPDGAGVPLLYVHWLSLRNPLATFTEDKPALPGQDVPGLGMAEESGRMLYLIAQRLQLVGVALRPAWFHVAWSSRYAFRFVDPERQGRFEALVRDLARLPLIEATLAVAEGRVSLDGAPYRWEPDLMVQGVTPTEDERARAAAELARARFTSRPRSEPSPRDTPDPSG